MWGCAIICMPPQQSIVQNGLGRDPRRCRRRLHRERQYAVSTHMHCACRHTDIYTYRHTGTQTYRHIDIHTNRGDALHMHCTCRQTDIQTCRHTLIKCTKHIIHIVFTSSNHMIHIYSLYVISNRLYHPDRHDTNNP
jgi:hypothetical protein